MKGINLEKNKYLISKKYNIRFWTIVFVLMSAVCLLTSALLFGYFLKIEGGMTTLENKLRQITNSNIAKNRIEFDELANDLNKKIKRLDNNILATDILYAIEYVAGLENKIYVDKYSINFTKDSGEAPEKDSNIELEISGIAPSRSDLLAFQNNLKSLRNFSFVDIPLSDFAKNKDINFHAKIVIKKINNN